MNPESLWKKCSTCKKPIGFGERYWACNVTTCNTKRLGLAFCSVPCWDGHVPVVRHRDSWSIEKKAPSRQEWESNAADETAAPSGGSVEGNLETEILVVVSKLKAYIKAKSGGMSTSGDVSEILSDKLRRACDEAIQCARQDGRKTVMARDFR